MARIPDEYTPVISIMKTSLSASDMYFDTGIVPTNNTNVNVMFTCDLSDGATKNFYVFGARNTNSNTSAGQLNLLFTSTSTGTYFGYASARRQLTHVETVDECFYCSNVANEIELNCGNSEIVTSTGSTTTFTGTRNIYAMAMNNAGTVNHGSSVDYEFLYMSIEQNGELVREYYPAKDSNGVVGLFDVVNQTFETSLGVETASAGNVEIVSNGNGSAFINMPTGQYSKFAWNNLIGEDLSHITTNIEAVADDGYVFVGWSNDAQGRNIFSNERILKVLPRSVNYKLYANFKKKEEEDLKTRYMLLGLQYGINGVDEATTTNGFDFNIYTLINNFEIKEDGLTKTVSTIVCDNVPSVYQVNMPVAIYTNKGAFVWAGLIESIEGNTLTCREGLSIFDEDFVFTVNTSWGGKNLTNYSIPSALEQYTGRFAELHTSRRTDFAYTNDCSVRKTNAIFGGSYFGITDVGKINFDRTMSYDKSRNANVTMPLIDKVSVANLEDYFLDLFDSTGYGVLASIHRYDWVISGGQDVNKYKDFLYLNFYFPNRDDYLNISDNIEFVKNVEIQIETQENTILEIYNSTGTTCRGVYGMQTDGTITNMDDISESKPLSSFIGYTDCRTAVVLSDDKINTLLVQYLSNSKYNHIITMEIDLNTNLYELEDFVIGRRVMFYNGNDVYESVITGKEYSLKENEYKVNSIKLTLGKVRNNLTDKINLTKVKKK